MTIGIAGLRAKSAELAIRRGFRAIRRIHRLMSFHESDSDVSRLNRLAHRRPIAVHDHTRTVLRLAQRMARSSAGVFDITVAPALATTHFLPAPRLAPAPDPSARWRDITIQPSGRIRFRRPLWIDLGGIAKGYAVDAAVLAMRTPAGVSAYVNAGGDLRITGPQAAPILLDTGARARRLQPVLELTNRALASSCGLRARRRQGRGWIGPHRHGIDRQALPTGTFVAVVARECATADALTKIVLACGSRSSKILRRFGAAAYVLNTRRAWRHYGTTT